MTKVCILKLNTYTDESESEYMYRKCFHFANEWTKLFDKTQKCEQFRHGNPSIYMKSMIL